MEHEFTNWEEFEKELNISSEQEIEIKVEMDIIKEKIKQR